MSAEIIILLDLRPLQTNYKSKGIGRYTRELALAIHKQYPVYGLQSKSTIPLGLDIPILINAPIWKRQWLWDMFILPIHLWIKGVTLFHNFVALGPLDSISYPVLYARKCLITIHDLHMFHSTASDVNKFYRTTNRIRWQKFFAGSVNKIITDAEFTLKDVSAILKIPVEKIEVITLGCEHTDDWKKNTTVSESYREILNSRFILSVGDSYNKNLKMGMLILEALRNNYPKLTWVICGNTDTIKETLAIDTLPEWILPNQPSDNDIYHLYKTAELTLIPSFEEGFGIPVLEAIKIGSPVVAGNIEVFKNLLPQESDLDPADLTPDSINLWKQSCEKLLNDKSFREASIKNGQRHSDNFTWSQAAEKIVKLYP